MIMFCLFLYSRQYQFKNTDIRCGWLDGYDLKTVYQAETKDLAEYNLLKLEEKWGVKYPMVIKAWQTNWENLTTYLSIQWM